MPFQITILETLHHPDGVTLPMEVERLKMTVDGPVDVMPIIALLQKKPRAPRKDKGTSRHVPQQETP